VVSLLGFLILISTTACTPSGAATSEADTVVVAVKQLATVNIPPTPDAAQREATRRALPVNPTVPPPTATYTSTPYIGIFLGTPNANDNGVPMVDAGVGAPTNVLDPQIGGCVVPFDPAFGTGWQSNPSVVRRIGCPLQQRFGFAGNVQVFEHGVMYQRIDTNEVWAIEPGDIGAGKFWYVNQPLAIVPDGIQAPAGLRIPANSFGSVWLTNGEVSKTLGYASTPEQTADLNVQRFDGGSLLLDVTIGQAFILFDDGDAFGPYQG
ncbi:MAG TPA: hypothetical protein VHL11_14005, partial [Phototrophicaceae bacterium]|nr:hypothetical protein [Phototrophicaceae bacterium]